MKKNKEVIKIIIFSLIVMFLFVGKVYAISDTEELVKTTDDFMCSDVSFLTTTWLILRIITPFLVLIFGSLDFFKSMIAGDEKKMRESRGKFFKRLIAFVLLIFLPFVVQFIFSIMGTYGSQNVCLVKCIVTNNTSETDCNGKTGARALTCEQRNSGNSKGCTESYCTGTKDVNGHVCVWQQTSGDYGQCSTKGSKKEGSGNSKGFVPPSRNEVTSCEQLTDSGSEVCNKSSTLDYYCKWDQVVDKCTNNRRRADFKDECKEFITVDSCNSGHTASYYCIYTGGQYGCNEDYSRPR